MLCGTVKLGTVRAGLDPESTDIYYGQKCVGMPFSSRSHVNDDLWNNKLNFKQASRFLLCFLG